MRNGHSARSELQVLRGAQVIHQRRQPLEVFDHEWKQFRRARECFIETGAGGEAFSLEVFEQGMVFWKALRRAAQAFAPELVMIAKGAAVHGVFPCSGVVGNEAADPAQRVVFRMPESCTDETIAGLDVQVER